LGIFEKETTMNIAHNRPKDDLLVKDREIFNKVPKVTLYFWIIKILCVAVGENTADMLSAIFGLNNMLFSVGGLLFVTLTLQISLRRYVPGIYWFTILLMSTLGTLVADSITDSLGIPLPLTITILSLILITTFVVWYASKKTLSINTIFTIQQEVFYWFAILLTFIIGIASEDFILSIIDTDYLTPILILSTSIAILGILYWRFKLNATLVFWIVYLLTHPLGSVLGTSLTDLTPWQNPIFITALFLSVILIIIIYLTFTKKDVCVPTRSSILRAGKVSQIDPMKDFSMALEAHGVNISTIPTQKWNRKQLEFASQSFPGIRHQSSLEEENLRLKQENKMLRYERDTLKNTISIFLRNQQ